MNKQINVLVTGANGLLGTAFRNHWKIRRYPNLNVKFSVHYDVAKREENDIVFDYLKMDNIDEVLKDIDVLINCVAFTNVNKAENDCWANEYLNAGCLKLLSEKCKEHNVFLIHFSTDFVYGEDNVDCNFEDTNLNPINKYGKAKLKGERIIQESGCKHIILRLSWLYSEFSPNFITTLIDKFIDDEKVSAISDMYSSLTYADDVVSDVFDIISLNMHEHSYNLTTHNVYNYHNNGYHSIYDVAKQIKNILRSESIIKKTTYNDYNFSAPRVKNTVSSINRFKTLFFTITDWYISLSQCIDRYLYLKNFNKNKKKMDCLKVFNTMVNHAISYFKANNIHAAILGISGGIDSTVVAYIFNEVERKLNHNGYPFRLIGISMPTETTDKDEFRISELVGHAFCPNNFRVLDITQEAQSITIPYVDASNEWTDRFRIGNVKSRLRIIHLYDLAKAYKGVVLGTDNYTEFMLGYSTIGGDGLFDYCPTQYLWKSEIYELANCFREIEKEKENWEKVHALDESIKIPPQAGLGITKTDMDEIQAPNYWVVDSILKCIVSNEEFDDDIDLEVKERILDRVFKNEYKKILPIVIGRESLIN